MNIIYKTFKSWSDQYGQDLNYEEKKELDHFMNDISEFKPIPPTFFQKIWGFFAYETLEYKLAELDKKLLEDSKGTIFEHTIALRLIKDDSVRTSHKERGYSGKCICPEDIIDPDAFTNARDEMEKLNYYFKN